MSTVDVTIVNPVLSDESKRESEVRLTHVLHSLDRARGYRQPWRVVARAIRPEPAANQESSGLAASAGQAAPLDYAAWHAHLAGTRRWAPDMERGTAS